MENVLFSGTPLRTLPGLVLTPRPATEAVVAVAAELLGGAGGRVADVGTGSGAIAVAVARRCPDAEVWATDTCAWAVRLARVNAWHAQVDDRVHVLEGDLLAPVPELLDLVLANLPYLPYADRALYPELRHEPPSAVFADGDGLGPYRRLLEAAESKLVEDGTVVFQLHRRVLLATRGELAGMRRRLEEFVEPALALPAAA